MNEEKTQGSFVTGFAVGIFAGALGYYLFATDKGKKLTKIAQQEWREAMEAVQTDKTGKPLPKTFREFMDLLLKTEPEHRSTESTAHKKSARKRSSASVHDRFRGM